MVKEELIERLKTELDQTSMVELTIKLIKGTSERDLDLAQVLKDNIGVELVKSYIINLSEEEYFDWLQYNHWDVFHNYRFAEKIYIDHAKDSKIDDYICKSDKVYIINLD